jgi:hypothetical protein
MDVFEGQRYVCFIAEPNRVEGWVANIDLPISDAASVAESL